MESYLNAIIQLTEYMKMKDVIVGEKCGDEIKIPKDEEISQDTIKNF